MTDLAIIIAFFLEVICVLGIMYFLSAGKLHMALMSSMIKDFKNTMADFEEKVKVIYNKE